MVAWIRKRTWFGYWWCAICSAHGQGHYRHDCARCRCGSWFYGSPAPGDDQGF